MRRLAAPFLGTLAALLAAPGAQAQVPASIGPGAPVSARSLALSAYRGLPPGNDAISYNPAALASRRAFTIEAQYLFSRVGADTDATFWGGSVVDSVTSSLAAGISYTYANAGGYRTSGFGGSFDVAIAFPVLESLYLGGTFSYLDLSSSFDDVKAGNVNAGLFWSVAKIVSLGAVGYNLIYTGHDLITPRALGAGVGVGDERVIRLGADFYRAWYRDGATHDVWSGGAELFLFEMLALRGGWRYELPQRVQWWSVGAGFSAGGFGVDAAYRQAFGSSTYRVMAGTLKVAVPGM